MRGSPAYTEYLAILNWLGEFDVTEEFAERANAYRSRIGVEHFPENGEAYLRALIAIAKEARGHRRRLASAAPSAGSPRQPPASRLFATIS